MEPWTSLYWQQYLHPQTDDTLTRISPVTMNTDILLMLMLMFSVYVASMACLSQGEESFICGSPLGFPLKGFWTSLTLFRFSGVQGQRVTTVWIVKAAGWNNVCDFGLWIILIWFEIWLEERQRTPFKVGSQLIWQQADNSFIPCLHYWCSVWVLLIRHYLSHPQQWPSPSKNLVNIPPPHMPYWDQNTRLQVWIHTNKLFLDITKQRVVG